MSDPDDKTSRDAQRAAADYVAAVLMELALIARNHRLETLGDLLDMVRLEAESVSRSNGRGS